METENPRFPHKCKILRQQIDENGVPITDENGKPLPPIEILSSNCGYRNKNAREAIVIEADYMIALPKHSTDIHSGDTIEITDYTRTYSGRVKLSLVGNLGANIWYDEFKA